MSINAALLIILLLIAVFFLFVEIFTVLFMLTGLPERKARFQVISILTNTGFATGESEVITSSRRRRRLATITMLFSATSNPLLVLDYYGDSAIVEIRITDLPDVLAGKTLAEGPLKTEYGLLVFVIKRAGEIRHDVGPDDVLQEGDRIVLFGSLKSVHALFRLKPSFSRVDEEDNG